MGEQEVFISYSRSHYEEAKKLSDQLWNYHTINSFLDKHHIPYSEKWHEVITEAIINCKVCVLMLNEQSNQSEEVEREIGIASRHHIKIFVVRTEHCTLSPKLEYYIGSLHYFDAIPPDDNNNKLCAAAKNIAQTVREVNRSSLEQSSNSETNRRTLSHFLISTLKRLPWRWILEIAGVVLLLTTALGYWAYIHRPALPEYDLEILNKTGQLVLEFSRRADMKKFGESENYRPPWYPDKDKITSVIIPENARSISKFAFDDCTNLRTVTIKGKITLIGERAFSDCTSLESVKFPDNLPDSLDTIDKYAFYACEALSAFDMPETLTSIGEHAFEGCHSLEKIDIPPRVTSIADSLFAACKHLKEVNVFGEVTEIGESAFYGTALEYAKIPKSVEKIGEKAFKSCEKLSEIEIPDSVTEIGKEAFMGCSDHAKISLPPTFLKNADAFPYDNATFTFRFANSEAENAAEVDPETSTEAQTPPETVVEPEAGTRPEPVTETETTETAPEAGTPPEPATETETPLEPAA